MAECAQCGLCCVDISIKFSPYDLQRSIDYYGTSEDMSRVEYDWLFILDNWTYQGPDTVNGHKYQCAQFDEENLTCMAHETRPNVCREYPWYDKSDRLRVEKTKYEAGKWLKPQCSYNGDVRTMLPIVEVRNGRETS